MKLSKIKASQTEVRIRLGLTLQGCELLVGSIRGLWKAAQSFVRPSSGTVTYRKWPAIITVRSFIYLFWKNKATYSLRSNPEHTGNKTEQQFGFHIEKQRDVFIPVALLLEWSLPGPFRGSAMEMFSWFVLTHFSLDREDRSQSHRPSSKSQSWNPSGNHTINWFTESKGKIWHVLYSAVSCGSVYEDF